MQWRLRQPTASRRHVRKCTTAGAAPRYLMITTDGTDDATAQQRIRFAGASKNAP